MWIARDKNGNLNLFNHKPIRNNDFYVWLEVEDNFIICEDKTLFPDLKWEDEPIKVELVSNEYFTRVCKDPCISCFDDYPLCTIDCKKYKNYVDSKR